MARYWAFTLSLIILELVTERVTFYILKFVTGRFPFKTRYSGRLPLFISGFVTGPLPFLHGEGVGSGH